MGVTFDDVTLEEAVAAGEALAAGPGFSYVVTPNPEIVAMARQTETYREILNGAGLVLPDGIGVVHAAKILGTPPEGAGARDRLRLRPGGETGPERAAPVSAGGQARRGGAGGGKPEKAVPGPSPLRHP